MLDVSEMTERCDLDTGGEVGTWSKGQASSSDNCTKADHNPEADFRHDDTSVGDHEIVRPMYNIVDCWHD